jgi:hypothetical protein
MELFTTTLDLYGGVLWSGELQGFIIHERVPTPRANRQYTPTCGWWVVLGGASAK